MTSIAYSQGVVTKMADELQRERATFGAMVTAAVSPHPQPFSQGEKGARALLVEWPAGMEVHQAARLARRKFLAAAHLMGSSPVAVGFNPAQRPAEAEIGEMVVFTDGEIPTGKIRVVGDVAVA